MQRLQLGSRDSTTNLCRWRRPIRRSLLLGCPVPRLLLPLHLLGGPLLLLRDLLLPLLGRLQVPLLLHLRLPLPLLRLRLRQLLRLMRGLLLGLLLLYGGCSISVWCLARRGKLRLLVRLLVALLGVLALWHLLPRLPLARVLPRVLWRRGMGRRRSFGRGRYVAVRIIGVAAVVQFLVVHILGPRRRVGLLLPLPHLPRLALPPVITIGRRHFSAHHGCNRACSFTPGLRRPVCLLLHHTTCGHTCLCQLHRGPRDLFDGDVQKAKALRRLGPPL
mmetsp:Transcript_161367/g.518101  ORF Transcript_161367/g.518101 Transcript_161367/m.518101 type:complete len:276 (+) Transcript_161367:269-1096(+)